ncbi:signal transduction histidine kinase [Parabacteroides sp. PF5-5]|uniref:sensor histidine kinase n=1 Tax=unclassified Parabacteroides TaxID=2649774 RepID=UPI0024736B40|nr:MULTISPECIES: ATP-binding protein [unclassified Parabacteroides]MDH6303769.1 signal transduction histidine kinase [Parabacteroides sp. PH5-39]MDH6314386.1 signal transduction histidine kinase [Parabacteroides sp. PF5-13]MDH6318549.1 signal transduction histidine kinase [Parabacteroides sp. PH5-13]MDH6322158.1 signal transduction histidine kinase [Parabacteroides sp. PH5-8]MDH6325762.1 signal transduction histidine kinase [Parabacteroides sp. PH5-41]
MTSAKKIAYYFTYITVGVITVVSIIFYLLIVLFPAVFLPYRIWVFVAFLLINGVLIYFVGKRYATYMIERIDNTYQSEKSFISNASHELNNPLTAIQGECEISLMRERTPAEYQIALQRILSETKRIIQLMKHLMFLSKGEDEILKSATETVFLAEYLMQFMENRIQYSPDNFAFTLNVNPQLLKIALENIIGNALKYSGDKPIEIRLRGTTLEIEDQGIGIPPEELSRIYQPFYRAGNTRGLPGNGIGLSLSIRILHVYGAEVSITSTLNKGTKVRIDFSAMG